VLFTATVAETGYAPVVLDAEPTPQTAPDEQTVTHRLLGALLISQGQWALFDVPKTRNGRSWSDERGSVWSSIEERSVGNSKVDGCGWRQRRDEEGRKAMLLKKNS
jgi:hypothetical protein